LPSEWCVVCTVVSQYLSIHRFQSIFYFSGLIIGACTKRYTEIRASVVSLPHSFRHYYRLCALSLIASVCTIAASSYIIVVNIQGGIEPWKGWADDHHAFSAVGQFPAVEWRNESNAVAIQVSRFFLISCPLLFFLFFGLAEEVQGLYRNAFVALITKFRKVTARIREACSRHKRLFGFDTSSPYQERGNPTLPVSTEYKLTFRHDLMASFSPNFSLSNVAFGASDFAITLANKQESDSSIEFSFELGTLHHTPSSDQYSPMPLPPAPARPEPAYVDVRDSKGSRASRALDGLPSDNIV
jgi:pheromone a factor receptor